MRRLIPSLLAGLLPLAAQAWGNHSPMCYRAFEGMPEVARAPAVKAEPLVDFLRDQEPAIARAVDAQEAWAREHLKLHAPRPEALRWVPDSRRSDADRRVVLASLTPTGREVVERATEGLNRAVFTRPGLAPDQVATLTAVLEEHRRTAGDL